MILPTCKEVSTSFARGDYDHAGPIERIRIHLHLYICWHCRRFRRQLQWVEEALRTRIFSAPDRAKVAALEQAVLKRM